MIVYHNNSCSKSCAVIELLNNENQPFQTIDYLNAPLTVDQVTELVKMLVGEPLALIRQKEEAFTPYKGKELTDKEWIEVIVKHPILLQRPIVIKEGVAVVGRPIEKVYELMNR